MVEIDEVLKEIFYFYENIEFFLGVLFMCIFIGRGLVGFEGVLKWE